LGLLGGRAAYVVHSGDGLDELTTDGPNRISHLRDGEVVTFELDATELGLRQAGPHGLRGGEPADNAAMMRDVLSGADVSPRRDVVLLNAAAALALARADEDPVSAIREALVEAGRSLDSGAALERLDALIALSRSLAAADGGQDKP
jgi:anthranilate phosphoribosyltransferase